MAIGMLRAFVSGAWLWRTLFWVFGVLPIGGAAATQFLVGREMLEALGLASLTIWQFAFAASMVAVLFFAAKISFLETPRIRLVRAVIQSDGNDSYFIRGEIENITSKEASRVKVECFNIVPRHIFDEENIDLPLVLLTQQRLRNVRNKSERAPHRRFSIDGGEPKKVELFQMSPRLGRLVMIHESGTEELVMDNRVFKFRIMGFGPIVDFSIRLFVDGERWGVACIRDEADRLALEQMGSQEWCEVTDGTR